MATRINAEQLRERLMALSSLYTQKDLSKKLGVSVRSVNYYQSGSRAIEKHREKINKRYNQAKSKLEESKIVSRETKRRLHSAKAVKSETAYHTCTIYEYINVYYKIIQEYDSYDLLIDLANDGYICAWQGKHGFPPPLEVAFVLNGNDPLEMTSHTVKAIVAVARYNAPSRTSGSQYGTTVTTVSVNTYLMPGFKKADTSGRLTLIRGVLDEILDKGRLDVLTLLGYYFREV